MGKLLSTGVDVCILMTKEPKEPIFIYGIENIWIIISDLHQIYFKNMEHMEYVEYMNICLQDTLY